MPTTLRPVGTPAPVADALADRTAHLSPEAQTTCATCDAPLTTARERAELLCARHLAGAAPTCACGEVLAPGAYSDRCRRCQRRDASRAQEAARAAVSTTCADCGRKCVSRVQRCRHCSALLREAAKRAA